jgi:3-methyl-2-oxobutanoate hydroxymethyltransferase
MAASSSSSAKVTALSLTSKKRRGASKITMVTAYDYPSGLACARAGLDVILVGDSLAMVELGHGTTQPVDMGAMLHHASAVHRGVQDAASSSLTTTTAKTAAATKAVTIPLLVADMPFGSYEYDDTDVALRNAYRFVKESGMDAVKLEVGARA